MGLSRVERSAVLLVWSLLFLGFVQGWRLITEEEFNKIMLELQRQNPAALVDTNERRNTDGKPSTIFDDENDIDEVSGDYDEAVYYDENDNDHDPAEPFYDKGEPDVDWKLKPKIASASNANLYEEVEKKEEKMEEEDEDKTEDPTGFHFVCNKNAFEIHLFPKELDGVKVIRSNDVQSVEGSPKSCGYVNRIKQTLMVPFSGCFARSEDNVFSVELLLAEGTQVRRAFCIVSKSTQSEIAARAFVPLNCPFIPKSYIPFPKWWVTPPPPTTSPTPPPTTSPTLPPTTSPTLPPTTSPTTNSTTSPTTNLTTPPPTTAPTPLPVQIAKVCSPNPDERVPCGDPGIFPAFCEAMDCCVDPDTWDCFYSENVCTDDGYFLFTIRHDSAPVPLDPTTLEIEGTNCQSYRSTETFAVFKIKNTECNTHVFNLGGTMVYLVEVQTAMIHLNLKYGIISRSNPIRFLIECRYSPASQSLASAGYMVMTPTTTVPSSIIYNGLYGIELRIATDDTYEEFYPTYHPPLRYLLGRPVYLQLLLLSPVPEAVILVNYCIAYPRSARRALVLIYEGCPNPHDPRVVVIPNSDYNGEKNERRFKIDAFQFIRPNTNQYIDEEIYFMCSVYLCFNQHESCEERCFDAD